MKPDLQPSDFAAMDRQNAWFAELHSKLGDNRGKDEGDIFVGLKWAIIITIFIVTAVCAGIWAVA